MRRLFALVALAVCAVACSGGNNDGASVSEVKRVLSAARLHPQKVRITVTLALADGTPLPPVNYCAAEAVRQDSATSLDVEKARAIVMVFENRRAADAWTPMPECAATPLRIANVIAVPTHGRLSERLQAALEQLR